MRVSFLRFFNLMFGLSILVIAGSQAEAQESFQDLFGKNAKSQRSSDPKLDIRLTPSEVKPGDQVTLSITVQLPDKHYTYSTDPSFPGNTRMVIPAIKGLKPLGDGFKADHEPKKETDPDLGKIEKFYKQVTWSRKFEVAADVVGKKIEIAGKLRYQVCSDKNCRPLKKDILVSVKLIGGRTESKRAITFESTVTPKIGFGAKKTPGPVSWIFKLSPQNAKPGDRVTLSVEAQIEENWHLYTTDNFEGAKTEISVIAPLNGLKPIDDEFQPSELGEEFTDLTGAVAFVHEGEITWTREYEVTSAKFGLAGSVKYVVCDDQRCLQPHTERFQLGAYTAAASPAVPKDVTPKDTPARGRVYNGITGLEETGPTATGLPKYLLFAFLGGLILNVMPCVLPVIAIKALSFVQQAGESRQRIFALNISYSAGVITVFLILATLAAAVGLSWGGAFQDPRFNVVMASIVFALGLSLLGVFEIPLLGLGSVAGGTQKEGLTGAFITGIFATVLATPCSGPFLGATLGWSVKQPVHIIYLVWTVMGLGMALPYLVFAVVPGAVGLLPKPGNWMVRFKEFAGFLLLGTVVFIFSFISIEYLIPSMIILLSVGLGLWMIGSLYNVSSPPEKKLKVRVAALVLVLGAFVIGWSFAQIAGGMPGSDFSKKYVTPIMVTLVSVAFGVWLMTSLSNASSSLKRKIIVRATALAVALGLPVITWSLHTNGGPALAELPWSEFNDQRVDQAIFDEGKTVLVDFTADW